MEKEKALLTELKLLIEELKKVEEVSFELKREANGVYFNNILRDDIGFEEKIFLCIMNGYALAKIGSFDSAESSFGIATKYAKESNNENLYRKISFELLKFYTISEAWTIENKGRMLRMLPEIMN